MDLVTFTEEILNGKLHFLCSVAYETKIVCNLLQVNFITIRIHQRHCFDTIRLCFFWLPENGFLNYSSVFVNGMKQAFALIVIQEIIVPLKKHNKTIALQSKTHDWFHYETQLLGRN